MSKLRAASEPANGLNVQLQEPTWARRTMNAEEHNVSTRRELSSYSLATIYLKS